MCAVIFVISQKKKKTRRKIIFNEFVGNTTHYVRLYRRFWFEKVYAEIRQFELFSFCSLNWPMWMLIGHWKVYANDIWSIDHRPLFCMTHEYYLLWEIIVMTRWSSECLLRAMHNEKDIPRSCNNICHDAQSSRDSALIHTAKWAIF